MKRMFQFGLWALSLAVATGCSSSIIPGTDGGADDNSTGGPSSSPMNMAASSIVGSWYFLDTNTSATIVIVVAFTNQGTYESDVLVQTSAQTWDDQEEQGHYAVSGGTLTLTPTMWTCHEKDPVVVDTFQLPSNGGLNITNAGGTEINYAPAKPSSSPGNGAIISKGCYSQDGGPFAPGGLQAVQN